MQEERKNRYHAYDFVIEELVVLYRNTKDEKYIGMLMEQIKNLMIFIIKPYRQTIPTMDMEDLLSEGYMVLVKVINDYELYRGIAFSTLLGVYVKQYMNRVYQQATRQKRFTSSAPESFEALAEINREGVTDSVFEVECEDFHSVELMEFIEGLELDEKERVAVNVLMEGGTKGDIAKELSITPASVTYYIKNIKNKFISAGFQGVI